MKNTAKRVLSLLMTLVMLFSLLPVQAFAGSSDEKPPLLPPPAPDGGYPHIAAGMTITLQENQSETYYYEGFVDYWSECVSVSQVSSGKNDNIDYQIVTLTGKPISDDSDSASGTAQCRLYDPNSGNQYYPYTDSTFTIQVLKGTDAAPQPGNEPEPEPEPEQKNINIKEEAITITAGTKLGYKLNATVDPAGTKITWSSSDKNVATVDSNGKVTGKAAGTTVITATAAGQTDTCQVTVESADEKVLVYIYLNTENMSHYNFPNLTVNSSGWYTMGYVALDEAPEEDSGPINSTIRGYVDSIIRHNNNTSIPTDFLLNAIKSYRMLESTRGANDYVADHNNAWHLDLRATFSDTTYPVEVQYINENTGEVMESASASYEFGTTVSAEWYSNKSISGYTFDYASPKEITVSGDAGKDVLKLYYKRNGTISVSLNSKTVLYDGKEHSLSASIAGGPAGLTLNDLHGQLYNYRGTEPGVYNGTISGDARYTSGSKAYDVIYRGGTLTINLLVAYDLNGGTSATSQLSYEVQKNTQRPQIEQPTREGYVLSGWVDQDGRRYDPNSLPGNIDKSYIFTAQWKQKHNLIGTILLDPDYEKVLIESGEEIPTDLGTITIHGYNLPSNSQTNTNTQSVEDGHDGSIRWTPVSSLNVVQVLVDGEMVHTFGGEGGTRDFHNIAEDHAIVVLVSKLANVTLHFQDESGVEIAEPQHYKFPLGTVVDGTVIAVPAELEGGYVLLRGIGSITVARSTIDLTATYTKGVVINYVAIGGGTVSRSGETVGLTGNPQGSTAEAMTGHAFVNWTDADGNVVSTNLQFIPQKTNGQNVSATYYANFTQSYTVTFVDRDTREDKTCRYNETVTAPEDPAQKGYTFGGWMSSVDGQVYTKAQIDAKLVTEDVTYTAQWTPNSVTIAYHSNLDPDAVLKTDTVLVKDASDYRVSGPVQMPEHPGFIFLGWADTADSAAAHQNGDPLALPDSGNKDLWAVWQEKELSVVYHSNYEEDQTKEDKVLYSAAGDYQAKGYGETDLPGRDGYAFLGWSDYPVATIANYSAGDHIQPTESGRHVYAVWENIRVTVTYMKNDGTDAAYTDTITLPVSDPYNARTLTGCGFAAREFYDFLGWAETADAAQASIQPGAEVTLPASGSRTLYAVWQERTVTVTYHSNLNPDTVLKMDTVALKNADAYKVNGESALPEYPGHTFLGWADAKEAAAKQYSDGDSVTLPDSGNKNLWAVWQEKEYSVVYHSNFGAGAERTDPVSYSACGGYTAKSYEAAQLPHQAGYRFLGWADSADGAVSYAAGAHIQPTEGGKHVYAVWENIEVTVTYHKNDGTADAKTDTITLPIADPYHAKALDACGFGNRDGWFFLGWAETAEAAQATIQPGDTVTLPDSGNRDLYAVWSQKQYRIYYYDYTEPFSGISDDAQYASGEKATVLGGGSAIADASGLRYLMGWTDVPGAYILNTQAEINAFRSSHTTYAFDSRVQFADSDIKLYAYWGPTNPGADIYEVSYRVHNTVTGETFDYGTAEQHANGQEVTVRSKYPDVQTGWQVTDWKANGITPTNGKFTMVGRDVLFTAELSRIEYPVTYQITAPEAFKNDSYKQETHYYGDALTLISDDMEQEGYTWSGWTGLPNTMPNEAVTVVGSYTVQQYTVTYKVDGEVYGAVETHNFGDALTLRAAPTRTGYTFSGWAPALPKNMPARNLEIVGSFKPIDYTLTYYVDGVKDGDSEVYHYEDPLTARTAPTRTGYTFSGWSPAVPEKMPANNLDVYGTFTINSYPYTVNYLLADSGEPVPGMQPTTGSQNYGTVYTATYPEITGYVKAPAVDGRAEPDLQLQITEGSNVLNLYYYKTLTVTVADARKNYGVSDADAGLTATVDAAQLLRAADEAGIPKSPIVRTAGQTGENIGQYGIEVQGKAAPQIAGDYYVTYVPGTLTIDPVAVTVTMGTMEKTYGDADPTQAEGRAYVTVSDGLVGSDTIPYAWSRESGEDVKAGGYPVAIRLDANVPAPAAENAPIAYGNYLVTFVDGTMIIKPKVLNIETFDGSKVYDGTPLVGTGKLDPAIAGESVTASFTTLDSVAKDVPNAYSLTWGEGTKSSNYQIHEVKIGKLTMTDSTQQIRVDVTGGTFVYDGTVHGAQVTVTGLPAGYTLQTARSNAAARNVSDGTVTAVCDALVIVNAAQENVTDRLNVVYGEPAALTILPRDIVFQSANGAKQYDGTPLTAPTVTVGGQYGFVPGEEQGVTFQVTGSLVGNPNQAEEADNEFTWTFDPAILDAANYSIRKVVGRLLVDPLPMHQLTIHYVYADGAEAAADFTDLFRQGEQYQVYSPVIAGFTADAVFVRSGPEGMPNADVEVTVVYRAEAVPQPADPGVEIVPDETEAGYRLEDVEDDAVPLAGGAEDGGHVDCSLHFLLMAAALIVQLVYMDKRKKYQERIFELKKQLGDTSMDEE